MGTQCLTDYIATDVCFVYSVIYLPYLAHACMQNNTRRTAFIIHSPWSGSQARPLHAWRVDLEFMTVPGIIHLCLTSHPSLHPPHLYTSLHVYQCRPVGIHGPFYGGISQPEAARHVTVKQPVICPSQTTTQGCL